MEKTFNYIGKYRRGVFLILTAVAINLIAGGFQEGGRFNLPNLLFYIAFSALMLVGFFVARSANVFGLYMGLIPYVYSLYYVITDFFSGNPDVVSTAWSLFTVAWFSIACYAYAKIPKSIDLGRTLPFDVRDQFFLPGQAVNAVTHSDVHIIEKGALRKDVGRMIYIAQKTKWRLTLIRVARWLTFLMLLEGLFYAWVDYTSDGYMTYHYINLLTLFVALILSAYKPTFAFYIILIKALYLDMDYFVLGFGYGMYPIFVWLLVVDILFFIFLYFAVWGAGTVPWAINLRETVKNMRTNKKLWKQQENEGMDIPAKQDWLLNSLVLKDVFNLDNEASVSPSLVD